MSGWRYYLQSIRVQVLWVLNPVQWCVKSHVEAEAAAVAGGVHVAWYKHPPKA